MLSEDSAFLRLPVGLDPKEAVFLDGMRHAVQIIDLSYSRLCGSLTELALGQKNESERSRYAHVFLDAWAFVDAVDRFRSLWEMQPSADRLPKEFASESIRSRLQGIRDLRNVSAHVSQKIEQIVSLNASVLGELSWVTVLGREPYRLRSFYIRPGVAIGRVTGQLAMPAGEVFCIHRTGYVSLAAGEHVANLSEAFSTVRSVVGFAESALIFNGSDPGNQKYLPGDIFGSADLGTIDQ
jgi:hypothetical protein